MSVCSGNKANQEAGAGVKKHCGNCEWNGGGKRTDGTIPCHNCADYDLWVPRVAVMEAAELQVSCVGQGERAIEALLREVQEGVKHDHGKLRMELVPVEAIEGMAAVLTFGAQKYSDRNWEKGMDWGRVYGALQRHLLAWWGGQELDPESGISHLHHASCCLAFLQTYSARRVGTDTRAVLPPSSSSSKN